ncbi:MAG: hypothetical protein JSV29_07960, partial [Candidatus Bathyarchaeota archaeon]
AYCLKIRKLKLVEEACAEKRKGSFWFLARKSASSPTINASSSKTYVFLHPRAILNSSLKKHFT